MSRIHKTKASLSLDLDNQWSYMKTHGDEGWQSFPSYLNLVVPRILKMLQARGLKITFFIVGQDAALDKNREALAQITAHGHEVGNHSFHHEPWIHLHSSEKIAQEISRAEDAISEATGQRPRGYRGPSFSLSKSVLEVLQDKGYLYDASTFPTFLGPLARAFYFLSASFSAEEKDQRKGLFGSLSDGFRPLRPYRWDLESGPLLELPVTTMPLVKVPFHLSYVVYLATFSKTFARLYFNTALQLCKLFRIEPSLLLHPTDFLGADDIEALHFFPGMSLAAEEKCRFVDKILSDYSKKFQVLPMSEHVASILAREPIARLQPVFSSSRV